MDNDINLLSYYYGIYLQGLWNNFWFAHLWKSYFLDFNFNNFNFSSSIERT